MRKIRCEYTNQIYEYQAEITEKSECGSFPGVFLSKSASINLNPDRNSAKQKPRSGRWKKEVSGASKRDRFTLNIGGAMEIASKIYLLSIRIRALQSKNPRGGTLKAPPGSDERRVSYETGPRIAKA